MLDQILEDIDTQGWSLASNFISDSELTSINNYFDEHKSEFVAAKVGQGQQKLRNEEIRGDYTLWLDPLIPHKTFLSVTQKLDDLQNHLNQKFFLGLKDFEYHLAYYPASYFYRRHVDAFEKGSSRIISFIMYLNSSWQDTEGGELVIYDREGKTLKKVTPAPGLMVCFLSHDFPHEVLTCQKERRSLTGWMHNRNLN